MSKHYFLYKLTIFKNWEKILNNFILQQKLGLYEWLINTSICYRILVSRTVLPRIFKNILWDFVWGFASQPLYPIFRTLILYQKNEFWEDNYKISFALLSSPSWRNIIVLFICVVFFFEFLKMVSLYGKQPLLKYFWHLICISGLGEVVLYLIIRD